MKMKNYTLLFAMFLGLTGISFGQSSPENMDYGVFPPGEIDLTPPANATFEFCMKPNINFPSVPAAAELNLYLGLPTSLFTGGEVFSVTEDNLTNGDMIWDPSQTYSHTDGFTYFVFAYNGGGINLAPFGNGNWVHAFTLYLTGQGPGVEPSDFFIADASSALWTDFFIRSSLNVLGFNEFIEMSSMEALPLDLISFTATKYQERSSYLEWVTINEINTSHFIVQRSENAKNWVSLGRVEAAGNSVAIENYSFFDENVYNGTDARAKAHYRLLMFDLDGRMEVSPIASVSFGNDTNKGRDFLVYPNPASDGVQVEWDAAQVDQPTAIEFYDVTGKLVHTVKVSDQTNQQYVDFGPTNIRSGLYLMRILSGEAAIEQRQIVVGNEK